MFENLEQFAVTVEGLKKSISQWEKIIDNSGQLSDEDNKTYLGLRKKLAEYNIILLAGRKLQLLAKIQVLQVSVVNLGHASSTFFVTIFWQVFNQLSEIFQQAALAGTVEELVGYQEKIAEFEREHPELRQR